MRNNLPPKRSEDPNQNGVDLKRLPINSTTIKDNQPLETSFKKGKPKIPKDSNVTIGSWEKQKNPESAWHEKESKDNKTSLVLMLAGLVTIVFLGCWIIFSTSNPDKSNLNQNITSPANAQSNSLIEIYDIKQLKSMAETCVHNFITAQTLQEKKNYVIGGDSTLPLMNDFYKNQGNEILKHYDKISKVELKPIEGLTLIAVSVDHGAEIKSTYLVIPTQDKVLIHWESSIGYSELALSDFAKERPATEKIMRVYLDGKARRLDKGDLMIRLNSANGTLWALVGDDKTVKEKTLSILKINKTIKNFPITAKLKWNNKKKLVEITSIEHLYWIDFPSFQPL